MKTFFRFHASREFMETICLIVSIYSFIAISIYLIEVFIK